MRRWSVVGVVAGSKFLGEFEAETKDQAIEMALNSDSVAVCLCHQCSSECEDPAIDSAFASPLDGGSDEQ